MTAAKRYGRYELIKRLAAGGMAQVFLARHSGMEGFEKLLVVKQVLPHLAGTEEFVTMFLDEARLAARLTHPNVVQVFDLGKEVDEDGEETLFIAMEFVHGEDLRRLDRESRRRKNPIPLALVCRIIADAASGLHYAHTLSTPDGRPLGIVHRDVSPQNVLVTFDGGVKVVDFGIAKAADRASKTRSGVLKGKYAYMSPEQASGGELDARSDVFALGIMLFELITGQRLFKRKSEILTLHAVVRCEVPRPSSLNPIVPSDLDDICLAALARETDDRFESAEAFQLALEDFLVRLAEPASSPHLAAYLRDVFSERLQEEVAEGGPVAYLSRRTLTGSKSVGLGGTTPSGHSHEGDSRVELDPAAAAREPPPPPVSSEAEPGSASRVVQGLLARQTLLMIAAAALIGVSSFGLGLLWFGRGEEGPVPTDPALSGVAPPGLGPEDPKPKAGDPETIDPGPDTASGPELVDEAGPAMPAPVTKPPPRGRFTLALTPASIRAEILQRGVWRRLGASQSLAAGRYKVRLTLPDGSTRSESVRVLAGRTETLTRRFIPGTVRVVITPFGSGGSVRRGKRVVGPVPGPPFELYPGTHTLTIVSEDGTKRRREKVKVVAGKESRVTVALE